MLVAESRSKLAEFARIWLELGKGNVGALLSQQPDQGRPISDMMEQDRTDQHGGPGQGAKPRGS